MKRKNVVLLGDSLLRGVILDDDKKYSFTKFVDWEEIQNELNVNLTNISKMGCCSDKGIKIFQNYLNKNEDVDTVIIEYGGNDCDKKWSKISENCEIIHNAKVNPEDFVNNVGEIIELAISKNIRPILMTLPPICALSYVKWVSYGLNYNNILKYLHNDPQTVYREQEKYSLLLGEIAQKYDVEIVKIREKFLESLNINSLLCLDGIHPNQYGQKIIVDAFVKHFQIQ
ncbi:MAG: SGNH/GDSL hydrolase family protein [Clostridia bacterium]